MTADGSPDLGAVYDEHVKREFVDLDLDATMATMVDEPHTYFAPTGAGGVGHAGVSGYYQNHFIGKEKWPADWSMTPVSRTVDGNRLVEEFVVSFTHEVEMDYWDQASVLVQVGLLDPAGIPVVGVEQAAKLMDLSGK